MDVKELQKVLEDPKYGGFDDVKVILDGNSRDIMFEIENAIDKKNKSDILLIYFSGHGKTNDANKLYLASSDSQTNRLVSTAIDTQQISEMLGESRADRTVLILDCCHAGAFPVGFKSDDALEAAAKKYANAGGSYVLMACGEYELARDGDSGELSHLTQHLVEGLSGAADVNEDGEVTVKELTDYLDQAMALGGGQKFSQAVHNQRGDILLARSGKTPINDILDPALAILKDWTLKNQISYGMMDSIEKYSSNLKANGANRSDPQFLLLASLLDNPRLGQFIEGWLAAETGAPSLAPVVNPDPVQPITVKPTPEPEPNPIPKNTPSSMKVGRDTKGGTTAAFDQSASSASTDSAASQPDGHSTSALRKFIKRLVPVVISGFVTAVLVKAMERFFIESLWNLEGEGGPQIVLILLAWSIAAAASGLTAVAMVRLINKDIDRREWIHAALLNTLLITPSTAVFIVIYEVMEALKYGEDIYGFPYLGKYLLGPLLY